MSFANHQIRFLLKGLLIVLTISDPLYAQETVPFLSYTGGFSINLPNRVRGVNGIGSGIRFNWNQPEAEYEIGFHEREGLPLAMINGKFSYEDVVMHYFNKFSTGGGRIYVKDALIYDCPGREYKYRTQHSILILRLALIGDRLYQLQAELPIKSESSENQVLQTFDTMRLLNNRVVTEHFAKQISEATPKMLPREPKTPKPMSDIRDRNLRGHVKSVLKEFAIYALNNSLKQRHPSLLEEFDNEGNLLRKIEYDSFGSPYKVTVYGYVAGKRVSRTGSIPHEYDIGGIAINFPGSAKPDYRFDDSYTYKYLNGNLVEERCFWNDGILFSRATYRYLINIKETFYFDGGNRPFRKIVANLDEKGNEVKLINFERDGRKFVEEFPFDIKYDLFDDQGNWTQRSTSRWYGLNGKGKSFPESIEYRTIMYYQE